MIQKVVANFSGHVRYDEMEGRKYIVAPMSMLTEGVHQGSGGPLLYPKDELFKTPASWNHKPVVVYHPTRNGEGVSACDPIILNNRKVGIIMNAREGTVTVNKKKVPALLAEAWLEEDRMNKVDERISKAVETNTMMELSTGLFTDNKSAEGDWNGKKYEAIACNYRPDHLALLPDLKGACSIEDGGGFLRLNVKPNKIHILRNAMSHGNIRSLLNSWLQDKSDDSWVEDVYDNFFIFIKDGKYFKGDYSIDNNALKIVNSFTEVVRVTEWRTKEGEFVGNDKTIKVQKENTMDKKKVVSDLIKSNSNSWSEENRETLEAMDEGVLEKMQSSEKLAAEKAVENAVIKEDPIVANKNPNDKSPTLKEYIDAAPPEVAKPLENMMASYEAQKTALIKKLTDNEKCPFTEAQLKLKDVTELKQLLSLASQKIPEDEDVELNFFGQDILPTENTPEEPLEIQPIMSS